MHSNCRPFTKLGLFSPTAAADRAAHCPLQSSLLTRIEAVRVQVADTADTAPVMEKLQSSSVCTCAAAGAPADDAIRGLLGVWRSRSVKENAPRSRLASRKRRSSFHAAASSSARCPAGQWCRAYGLCLTKGLHCGVASGHPQEKLEICTYIFLQP